MYFIYFYNVTFLQSPLFLRFTSHIFVKCLYFSTYVYVCVKASVIPAHCLSYVCFTSNDCPHAASNLVKKNAREHLAQMKPYFYYTYYWNKHALYQSSIILKCSQNHKNILFFKKHICCFFLLKKCFIIFHKYYILAIKILHEYWAFKTYSVHPKKILICLYFIAVV